MVIRELINVLDSMSKAYNSEDYDFFKWYSVPLLVIEDSGNSYVDDPVILERVFGGVAYCKKYLDLPSIDFHLQHLWMESDTIALTKIVWEFFNPHKKIELILEIGYVLQKKDNAWKIISMIQPTWRDPLRKRKDITIFVDNPAAHKS